MMMDLHDDNRDGLISSSEAEQFRLEAFEHLRSSDYFVLAYSGQNQIAIPDAVGFNASVVNGRLRYSFKLPLTVDWSDLHGLVVACFDRSYFTEFLSEAGRKTYAFGNRRAQLAPKTLQLESEGWGTIKVRALEVALQ
jgi:ABC-type uncharacterized transport system substrate-binding protein